MRPYITMATTSSVIMKTILNVFHPRMVNNPASHPFKILNELEQISGDDPLQKEQNTSPPWNVAAFQR
jgi:hypothetical protein